MDEGAEPAAADAACSAERWLSVAEGLVPAALDKARSATGFSARWKLIVSRLERVCPCLSDLSGHPCFSKNALCREQLQAVCATLAQAVELADLFRSGDDGWQSLGKLHVQSRLDSLVAKLDLNLRDCAHLVKTGVLGDVGTPPASSAPSAVNDAEAGSSRVRELLARLQIGHAQAKYRAAEGLLEAMKEDEKSVLGTLGRTDISALAQLLAPAAAPKTREKAAAIVCALVESGSCENLLLSEGVLSPLIRLAESGGPVGREKAVVSLQRLSVSAETARSIVGHGGVPPLIEICHIGDSISQSASAGTLKNLSAVPEVRQTLAEEGIIGLMINLLECGGIMLGSKEHAAECLQNLTSSNESLRRWAVSEGVISSLLAYLDGPLPQEPAVAALGNLVSSVPTDALIKQGLLPRLQHVLKDGSRGAQHAAASIICKISSSNDIKRSIGECGCIPLLFNLLGAKADAAREAAAQGIASLMGCPQNCREVKRDERSVPSLVRLFDPAAGPGNTVRKCAVSCLLALSSSKRCRKSMVSYGAVGYLKKLSEADVPGLRKLIERLERGKLRRLFSRK